MNAKCANQSCPEYGLIKQADHVPDDDPILCGHCWELCERTPEPMPEPEVTDDNPTD